MNKFFKYIICCLLPLTAISCIQDDIIETVGNDDIVLTFDGAAMTKAADTNDEAYVSHVDVIIFNSSEAKVYNERVQNNGTTSFTLAAKRSSFGSNAGYYVYLVANSNEDISAFDALADVDELRRMVQADNEIMFANVGDTKHNFLMDAVAYTGNTEPSTPGTVILYDGVDSNSTYLNATFRRAAAKVFVTINKGTNVTFADAANSTSAAYYMRNCPSSTTVIDGYDINPILVTPASPAAQNKNFVFGADQVTVAAYAYEYNWAQQSIQDKETSLVVNIPMIVTGDGGQQEVRTNNWYKVPVSQTSSFERNHIYTVNVTVNALGATNQDTPQTLEDLTYGVVDWSEVGVTVGDATNNPAYLQLNTNHVNMYNVNVDNTTLEFASSSEIAEIQLLEAYYYNYLDQRIDLSVDANDKYNVYESIDAVAESGALNGIITINSPFVGLSDSEIYDKLGPAPESVSIPEEPKNPEVSMPDPDDYLKEDTWRNSYQYIQNGDGTYTFQYRSNYGGGWRRDNEAQADWESALAVYQAWISLSADEQAAKIAEYQSALAVYNAAVQASQALKIYNDTVTSLKGESHSNAIRYLKFKVTNTDGQTAEFTVNQYPTLYITNEHGWYSYRDDFGGTTYENPGTGVNACSEYNRYNDTWSYHVEEEYGSKRFQSKVYDKENKEVDYYYWSGSTVKHVDYGELDNHRMYHVHVTATSSLYTVARPRLDSDGYTESSSDNAKLVSPSFMIASQLGATTSPGSVEEAKSHCSKYVEVTEEVDGTKNVYDDWRLPTEAEVEIIILHQYKSDAMAEVLSGKRYWCAFTDNGNYYVSNTESTTSNDNTAVRCVRDVY